MKILRKELSEDSWQKVGLNFFFNSNLILISSFYAAEYIDQCLSGKVHDLNLYTKKINNIWGKSMAWGRRIAQVFYRFPRTGYQLGVKRKTAPKRIAQILSGELNYEDLAKRVITRLLTKSGT